MIFPGIERMPAWAVLGFGMAAGWVRSFWAKLYGFTFGHAVSKARVQLRVERDEHSDAYVWLLTWMEKQLTEKRVSGVLLRRAAEAPSDRSAVTPQGAAPGREAGYELVPAYGSYRMHWRSRYILVIGHTKGDKGKPGGAENSAASMESFGRPQISLEVNIWGTRNRRLLLDLIEEARRDYERDHPEQLEYFTHRYDYWQSHTLRRRSLDTIYLPLALLGELLGDMKKFLGAAEVYRSMGVPYRRGYGLFGPPGTGKTSLVQALAAHFGLPLYYLNLNSKALTSDSLAGLLDQVRSPSILLMEDVDSLTAARERDPENTTEQRLSTADLLNALDGIIAGEGRVVMMTSNHPERLDKALVRAGRLDRKWTIGYPEEEALLRFHERASAYFEVAPWEQFVKSLPQPATLADAQALAFGDGMRFKAEVGCE